MSRLFVDRISPYQSASIEIDGLDTSNLTTKTTFNSYTSSNDSKVTSLINATGSYAATNVSNTFTAGPQIASASNGNGVFTSKPLMPTSGLNQTVLWETNNQNLSVVGNGDYNVVQETLSHLQGYGRWYDGSWYQEFYNSAYTDGTEVSANGGGWRAAVYASGSSNSGQVLIQDNYNGDTKFQVDAQGISIGESGGNISIGNSGGSLTINSGNFNIAAQDPLPAGNVGDLAVSGSNLYFHNGSEFKQVAFV
jgi:hypothetical protein